MIRAASIPAAILLGASLALAQAGPERVPVTDPDQLAAIGMPRDAKNVFRWIGPGSEAGPSKSAAAAQPPLTWGTATGFTTLSSMQLKPEHASAVYQQPDQAYCVLGAGGDGTAQEALAELSLPDGSTPSYLSVWGYDADPAYGMTTILYEFCQAQGFNPPTTTLLGSLTTMGSGGRLTTPPLFTRIRPTTEIAAIPFGSFSLPATPPATNTTSSSASCRCFGRGGSVRRRSRRRSATSRSITRSTSTSKPSRNRESRAGAGAAGSVPTALSPVARWRSSWPRGWGMGWQ